MIRVNVALPSGRNESLSVHLSSSVKDLRILAQKSFGQSFLKLITPEGHALVDSLGSLQTAGIQDGDHLTAVAQQAKLAATEQAFALWCCGGDRLLTWGNRHFGGHSAAVQEQFRGVQQVGATSAAFAAILADGSVTTWGNPGVGRDSSAVRQQLKNVQHVQSTNYAFAAVLADGSVVTWGIPSNCDVLPVQHRLRSVQQLQATSAAFAAILADRSVVTWGDPLLGGDSSAVKSGSAVCSRFRRQKAPSLQSWLMDRW